MPVVELTENERIINAESSVINNSDKREREQEAQDSLPPPKRQAT